MSGKIDSFKYIILIISIATSVMDLAWGKIFNWFTVPLILVGIAVSSYLMGWSGAGQSLLGISVGLMLFGSIFGSGFLGGGDVKILMALGAWGGQRFTVEVAVLSIFVGGVLALVTLVVKGKALDFSRKMSAFLMSVFVRELEVQFPKIDKKLTMPFGVSISIAAVWIAFADPWGMLGVQLWP